MLCILYVITISATAGLIGFLAEGIMPSTWARRWLWLGVIVVSMVVPPIYRFKHTAAIHDVSIVHASSWDPLLGRMLVVSMWISCALAVAQVLRVWYLIHSARRAPAIVDGVESIVTDSLGPATIGVIRSRVLIPRWVLALPAVQRRYVLRHEQEHRDAHDTLLLFLASLAGVLAPWNLPIWWQLRRLRLAVEMDCDRRVVAALGDAHAYSALLLKVAEAASRGAALQPALLGVGMLEQRLTQLVAPSRRTIVSRVAAAGLAIGLLYLVFVLPHPVAGH